MNLPYRIGHGFDLHRMEPGLPLVLGGVKIEHERGCAGHSDGDVIYHCVTDAILGAVGEPDIGQLFPDNDPQWKGADSKVFVAEADRLMREQGYVIGNLDVTVIAQAPKLAPHKQQIIKNLAFLLGCEESRVNVKGKTHERVDSIGRGEAIACHAVVLLAGTSVLNP